MGKIKIVEKGTHIYGVEKYFSQLRQDIENRIINHMPAPARAIAVGILVGDASAIDGASYEAIRKAGLAHIIAISGMHIVVVVGLIFLAIRFLLCRFEWMLLHVNIKKTAAIIAIAGSLFYLLIAGSPLSAQRAFIMSTIVLVAIVLDRNTNPMRSVAISAIIILLLTPEAILSASLQMSFAASIALVSVFNLNINFLKTSIQRSLVHKFLSYVCAITTSTLVAGIATAPFIVYHFNQFSTYSVLSNLIAIPLADFIIMPTGITAMLLMPFGLEKIALLPMQWGIELVLSVANWVASLPHASYYVPSLTSSSLAFTAFWGLMLCILSTRLRYLGLLPLCFGIVELFLYEKPDLIISGDGKLFAVKDNAEILAFSSKSSSRFNRHIWQQSVGENLSFSLAEAYLNNCTAGFCKIEKNGKKVLIIDQPNNPEEHCKAMDIFINLSDIAFICNGASHNITRNNLMQNGAHSIWLGKERLIIRSVSDFRPVRVWNRITK